MTACSCGSALCPRCGKAARDRQGWGVIEPLLLIGTPLAVFGFCPAFIPALHGQTDTGGFRWTATTTVACSAWWGVLLLSAVIFWVSHRTAHRTARPPRGPLPVEVLRPAPPSGPDPAVTVRLLADLADAEDYAGLVEDALTGEELDYLQAHGMLPDGPPFREAGRESNPRAR